MAKTLVYDCFSGISGDMHIGAMLDLGVSESQLRDGLARLEMGSEFELQIARDARHGITGTRATVRLTGAPGHHRHLADIERIVRRARYPQRVEQLALDIFGHIARAEAKIHDKPVEAVHFHEVGATDSIVDIVAAALCIDALDPDRIYCKTLELGGGMVRCAHGLMPVPAPATAEILAGVPCRYDGVDQEATTPTGAAILKQLVHAFQAPEGFRAERVGYGVGQKNFDIPNVLRVMLGTSASTGHGLETETNCEIDCNIDDMPAEAFQPLVEKLLAAGARDVYLTPIIMKKARPATKVSVLCAPADVDRLESVLFANSTTLGVRVHDVHKHMLPRQSRSVSTSLGDVMVKIATLPNGGKRWKVEHDDVVRIAEQSGREYLNVRALLDEEVAAKLKEETGT
ncbi:MAG TPA: nickel pincer cofactor biosynthesis protein LarC [Pseudomonadales bacterium]